MRITMKEVEKKARVSRQMFEAVKQELTILYGSPEHILAQDFYYTMPPLKKGDKNRFRIRKNYSGYPLQLQSIVVNSKRKQTIFGNLENNVEHEFTLCDEAAIDSFTKMMSDFGAKAWYNKSKDKYVFVAVEEVEYHIELCTVPIRGVDEHFLEIEGVYPEGLSETEEQAKNKAIDDFVTAVFRRFGIENAVETRPYRELMGVEYPKD